MAGEAASRNAAPGHKRSASGSKPVAVDANGNAPPTLHAKVGGLRAERSQARVRAALRTC
eukprot:5750442-Prymnesium_polylepis.1